MGRRWWDKDLERTQVGRVGNFGVQLYSWHNNVFCDLHSDYTTVFTLCDFIKLYTEDLCVSLYIYFNYEKFN